MNKRLRQVGVVLVTLVSLGAAAPVTTADAATWHKGLPKIIRHKMYRTKFNHKYGYLDYDWYKGTKSVLTTHRPQSGAALTISNTKYKKVGKTYVVKGVDKLATARNKYSGHPGKAYGYYRIRKVSQKKIKIAEGKKAQGSKYVTVQRFYHYPKVNGHAWK
ncbi:MAG: hypothetical protein LKH74_05380 [Levilactobacillus sp.]|jgi:hypothetical protein|uniref:hypothetical protein n=1 Tax=Levilactobacillus sp. TaxID=2767919 RepID=UPI00258FD4E2|nr:hypothetical protein [Levilactobacillus sp.]MCI1553339.1 hypothetical protein [Levilactobacillus sp.]MCI1599712.1 hypothetical protein [Levilactobacillus sp.]MCI1606097.1 hypothetical protein [Levilactobacillus sp.]